MMRLTITLIILFCIVHARAGDIPKFGVVSLSEAQMKACEFDKEANAMILYHCNDVYLSGNTTVQELKIRIKIFNEKAIESTANVKIEFDTDQEETIDNIEGATFNLVNGQVIETELKKESIYTEKAVNGKMAKVFAMPAVKPGSVIEYKYKFKNRYSVEFPSWFFQSDLPCLISKYNSLISQQFQIQHRFFTTLPVEKNINEGSGNTEIEFIMRKVPALPHEIYMSSERDYLQRVQFELMQINTRNDIRATSRVLSWDYIYNVLTNGYLSGYFYEHVGKKMLCSEDYVHDLAKQISKKDKMIFIYNYVKNYMTWDHKATFLCPKGVRIAWNNRTGSYGDINIALINLLKDAGIETAPVLGSTKEHGSINTFFPSMSQFNTVVAEVKIDNEVFILDASSKKTPYYLIAPQINHSIGYKINKKGFNWIEINSDKNYKTIIHLIAEINEQDQLKGEVKMSHFNYARINTKEEWSKGKENFMNHYLENKAGMIIEDISVENVDNDTLAFVQNFKFTQALQKTGNYTLFKLNFFNDFIHNPFTSDTRYTDIDFDAKQWYSLRGSITMPEKYEVENLPANQTLMMPDSSIIVGRMLSFEFGVLNYKIDIEFMNITYPTDDYLIVKDFYKKLFALLDESILLKPKS